MAERAITWQRVSTDRQDEASQSADIAAWVEAKGYKVAKAYKLHGASAYHGHQDPELQDMLARIRDGQATVVVVWHSDRLERRGALPLLNLLAQIKDAGARVESVKEPELGAASMGGQIMTFLGGLMAHAESAHKSDRIIAKQAALRAAGSFASGKAPFGYEIVTDGGRKILAPTPVGRVHVPQIFTRITSGASLLDVARWLTAEGVKTVTGLDTWNQGTVRQVVMNGTYAGRVTHKGVTYARCEALVTADVQRAAQDALKARGTRRGQGTTGRAAKTPALIKGMRCGDCGSPMYRIQSGNGEKRRPFYRCYGAGPQRKGCGVMIGLGRADATVTAILSGNTSPHRVKSVVRGTDWAAEIQDTALAVRELDVLAPDYETRRVALMTELRDYQGREKTADQVAWTTVRNADGTAQTVGGMFAGLDFDGQRAYIATCQITATRQGVKVVTPSREVPA